MRSSTRIIRAAALAAPLLLAMLGGCGKDTGADREDDRGPSVNIDGKNAKFVAHDSARQLGDGDIRITSADSAVDVALMGDSVVVGLGAKARAKVQAATDTAAVKNSGMGGSIEKMVKGAVAGALAHDLEYPISAITDVRYEEGLLRFYDTDGRPMHLFEKSRSSGKGSADMFRAADAQAFIDAFKAKKGKKY